MKTGPFAEHSNQLWGVSGVPTWAKVNSGLIKMYRAEVSDASGICLSIPPTVIIEYLVHFTKSLLNAFSISQTAMNYDYFAALLAGTIFCHILSSQASCISLCEDTFPVHEKWLSRISVSASRSRSINLVFCCCLFRNSQP